VKHPSYQHVTKALTVASDINQFSVVCCKLIPGCEQGERELQTWSAMLTEDNGFKSCGIFKTTATGNNFNLGNNKLI
jgi:hypothetical protein